MEDLFGGRLALHRRQFLFAASSIASAQHANVSPGDPLEFEFQELAKRYGRAQLLVAGSAAKPLVDKRFGDKPDGAYNLGSAANLPIALCALHAVERGWLKLETRVGQLIPQASGPHAAVSLRQLLSHSSGISAAPCNENPGRGQAGVSCIDAMLRKPIQANGQVSMSQGGFDLARSMIERASSRSFGELWKSAFAQPMGLAGNWNSASANDLVQLGRMLLEKGLVGKQRVLTAASVDELLRDPRPSSNVALSPFVALRRVGHPLGNARPGLGVWTAPKPLSMAVVPAASGLVVWVDFAKSTVGVLAIQANLRESLPVFLIAAGLR